MKNIHCHLVSYDIELKCKGKMIVDNRRLNLERSHARKGVEVHKVYKVKARNYKES